MQVWLGKGQKTHWPEGTAVTIGNFDGVHRGHRHILQRLHHQAQTRALAAVGVLFEPQPQEFFVRKLGKAAPYRLSPLRDKLDLLAQTGYLDAVWVLRFNQRLADMSAADFIRQVLVQQLNTRYLLVGDDFRFGAQRGGDFGLLSSQPEFTTERTPSLLVEDIRASSTAVRRALAEGDLRYAQNLLGHEYVLSGHVKYGAQLGRTLGCPTANIHLPQHHYALSGVFVVDVTGEFGRRRGVASFGVNPTVSHTRTQKLEVHLFDWHDTLYGKRLHIHFLHKLRDELTFDGLDALKAQIQRDMDAARIWQVA